MTDATSTVTRSIVRCLLLDTPIKEMAANIIADLTRRGYRIINTDESIRDAISEIGRAAAENARSEADA